MYRISTPNIDNTKIFLHPSSQDKKTSESTPVDQPVLLPIHPFKISHPTIAHQPTTYITTSIFTPDLPTSRPISFPPAIPPALTTTLLPLPPSSILRPPPALLDHVSVESTIPRRFPMSFQDPYPYIPSYPSTPKPSRRPPIPGRDWLIYRTFLRPEYIEPPGKKTNYEISLPL